MRYKYKISLALSLLLATGQINGSNRPVSAQTAAKPDLPRAVQVQARKTSSISHAYEAQAKQALRALDSGDYLSAINLWTKLNSDYPNKAEPYYQRAVVRRQIGDLRGALDDLDHALAISPNLAGALVQRAAVRHRLNDLKGAQLDIERACELTPNNYQALAVRGSVKYALGDFQGALADYNQASAINPDMGKRVNKYVSPQVGQSISSSQQALESQFAANMSNIQVDKQSTDKANFYSANSTTGTTSNTRPGAPQVQASWQVNKRSPKKEAESGTNIGAANIGAVNSNTTSATGTTKIQSESSRYEEIPTYSPAQLAHLNNQAAQAINNKQFSLAVDILEKIIKASPDYEHGRENLVIAHNNWGLSQAARNPKEAMKQFRAALFIDPTQPASRRNLNALIKENEEDPESAELRMRLSDELKEKDDLEGSYVEITEALRLRNTREGRSKLAAVIAQMERLEAGENTSTANATARGTKAKAEQLAGTSQTMRTRPVKKAVKPYVQEVLPSPSAGPLEDTPLATSTNTPAMQPQIVVSPQARVTAPDTIAVGEQPRAPEQATTNEIGTTAEPAQTESQAQAQSQERPQPHVKAFDQESMLSRLSTAPEEVLLVARQFATEGNFMDAEELLVKLVEHIRAKQMETQQTAVLESALETLTSIYQKQHKPDKEEVYLRALVKLQERSHHPDDPQFGKTLAEYATVLKLNGKAEEAAKQETRATAILGRISSGGE